MLVNIALEKSTKANPFYSNVTIDNQWDDLSKCIDLECSGLLTNKNSRHSNNSDQTDNNDDVEGNDNSKEVWRELNLTYIFQL